RPGRIRRRRGCSGNLGSEALAQAIRNPYGNGAAWPPLPEGEGRGEGELHAPRVACGKSLMPGACSTLNHTRETGHRPVSTDAASYRLLQRYFITHPPDTAPAPP